MLITGQQTPEFTLYSAPDQKISLATYRGKNVILSFYPADWSPVCGDQMTLYNEMLEYFSKYNAQLLGISVDSKWSHFAYAETNKFQFPLLADFEPKGEIARLYKVYNETTGEAKRALFVIDKTGILRWSFISHPDINPGAEGIIKALENL